MLTNAALLMNERIAHTYSLPDLLRLMVLGVTGLFVYHPVLTFAHAKGFVDFLRGRKSWDKFARNGRAHTAGALQS
jgi:hypothetical protein